MTVSTEALDQALEGAQAIAWDGEYRIYIVRDLEALSNLMVSGFTMRPAEILMLTGTKPALTAEQAREKLLEWYEAASGRRFISTLSYRAGLDHLAGFQYTAVIPREDI